MLNLFKIEWIKIKTYRTFWVLYLSFVVFSPMLLSFAAYKFMNARYSNLQEMTLKALAGSPFVFPQIWNTASYFAGFFFLIIGMLYILLISNEVQYRTHRQNIIDGWSRMDFLKAKFTLLIFFVVTTTAVVFLTALFVGLIYTPPGFNLLEGMYYIGYFALMATVYLMVAFLIAILIKRTGLSIIIYFVVVCIVDNILWLSLTINGSQLGYFMPVEVTDSLVPNPTGLLRTRTVSDLSLIIGAFAYISVYAFIIINYFRKADLKT
jgi:ABC-2 type transport system permease protein